MKLNFLKNKLFLYIFILFFCNKYTFSNIALAKKENIYLNAKKFLYVENNLKKKYKKECFLFLKRNKKYLVTIQNKNCIGFLKNNNFDIFYVVKKNDTLYSIAKRFQSNVDTLLKYNNLHKPYRILVGQKILVNNISMVNNQNINYIIYSDKYKKHILYTSFFNKKFDIINILNKNTLLTEICFIYNKYRNQEKDIFFKYWYWPLKNSNMQFFYNYSINKEGVEIEGVEGQPVFAMEQGKVVYISNTFKNYGKLIIIKHNNDYLSIYGFNKKIFIKLNDQVHANQKISTIGYSENSVAKLYFEVRFQGNPINLLSLFPKIKLKKHRKFN
ncbi:peptidoglycan DD-metalloendopeptidase family protein [Buchnera aphidicola]|uniref:Peptidoglycan DD-metalloendopeptidase family protein n=1 Tax=Buchnera aphidicola (Aphis gossypii) TaxID=98785 RepID=A0A5J6ZA03_9GAMM|nr:peptidoglycan DD-metalloendopeptidase family protein [Buchnera aphidicola]QFQ32232.1 peptidoglycan DD-metalloendopeptidase family protein [Buchnera aphidicola (Aphis gossypii)]